MEEVPQIVTDKYLIEELNLSINFINAHARRMGSFGRKPRKFFLDTVLTHLRSLSNKSKGLVMTKEFRKARNIEVVDKVLEEVFTEHHIPFRRRKK